MRLRLWTPVAWACTSFAVPALDRSLQWAEIRATFNAFVGSLARPIDGVSELRLLMRAVNAIALRFPIKQPRWRRGRWKSKT